MPTRWQDSACCRPGCLNSNTQVHLREQDWGSAFQLARTYALDPDVVLRARWAAAPVSKANITDNLARMSDRRWVVLETQSGLAPDYETARQLLNYGLRETGRHCLPPPPPGAQAPSPGAPPSPQVPPGPPPTGPEADWHRAPRVALWGVSDKLETYMVVTRRVYEAGGWASFRDAPLQGAAAALAACGNVSGLQAMVGRHPRALLSHLLRLLELLPETLDPRTYSPLLPRASDGGPSGLPPLTPTTPGVRRPDPVETPATVAALMASGQGDLVAATEELLRVSGAPLARPSPSEMTEWYVSRALALDEVAGQLAYASTLLELAGQKGCAGGRLTLMLPAARLVTGLVKAWWPGSAPASHPQLPGSEVGVKGDGDASPHRDRTLDRMEGPVPPAWSVTLGGFVSLEPAAQLSLLVGACSEAAREEDVDKW